jgi:hypothetical protein
MPNVASSADLGAHTGQQVSLVGRYEVIDTGRHKVAFTRDDGSTGMTNKLARVGLDDGAVVDLWVRPADEMAKLDGKRVVAVGKLIAAAAGGPDGAAEPDASPSLVQIESVREADQ